MTFICKVDDSSDNILLTIMSAIVTKAKLLQKSDTTTEITLYIVSDTPKTIREQWFWYTIISRLSQYQIATIITNDEHRFVGKADTSVVAYRDYLHDIHSMMDFEKLQYSMFQKYKDYYDYCCPITVDLDCKTLSKKYYVGAIQNILNSKKPVLPVKLLMFCEVQDQYYAEVILDEIEYPNVSMVFVDNVTPLEMSIIKTLCAGHVLSHNKCSYVSAILNRDHDNNVIFPNNHERVNDYLDANWHSVMEL